MWLLVKNKMFFGGRKVSPSNIAFDSAGNMKAQLGFAFRHERGERRRSLPLVLAAGFLLIAACDNVHPVQGMLRKTGLALQMGVMRACGVRCDALAAKGAKAVLLPDTVPPDGTAFKVGQMGIVLAGIFPFPFLEFGRFVTLGDFLHRGPSVVSNTYLPV